MLYPKKVKHRKWQRARVNPNKAKIATRGLTLAFGSYGLKALEPKRVRANQIESARKVLSRAVSKTGRTWLRIFPDRPFTAKAAEVGMGKGKGDVQGYEVQVWPGTVIFEIDGVSREVAGEALRKAGAKLPLKTKMMSRE